MANEKLDTQNPNVNVIIDRDWLKPETTNFVPSHGHGSGSQEYTPLQRWQVESASQQPYHNIHGVMMGGYKISVVKPAKPAKPQDSSVGYLDPEDRRS